MPGKPYSSCAIWYRIRQPRPQDLACRGPAGLAAAAAAIIVFRWVRPLTQPERLAGEKERVAAHSRRRLGAGGSVREDSRLDSGRVLLRSQAHGGGSGDWGGNRRACPPQARQCRNSAQLQLWRSADPANTAVATVRFWGSAYPAYSLPNNGVTPMPAAERAFDRFSILLPRVNHAWLASSFLSYSYPGAEIDFWRHGCKSLRCCRAHSRQPAVSDPTTCRRVTLLLFCSN